MFECATVCRKVLDATKCDDCTNTLEAFCPLTAHGILMQCEYSSNPENRIFTYPTALFMSKFKVLFKKVQTLLPFVCHEKLVSQKLITSLGGDVLQGLGCSEHCLDISQKIKNATVKQNINLFRKEINDILRKQILEPWENQHEIFSKAFMAQKKGVGKHVPLTVD